jgi:hypothetical protein
MAFPCLCRNVGLRPVSIDTQAKIRMQMRKNGKSTLPNVIFIAMDIISGPV